MLPFFAVALRLFPSIVSLLTDDRTIRNAAAMKEAVDVAVKEITDAKTPQEADDRLKDPGRADRFKLRMAELSIEAERIGSQDLAAYNQAANESTASSRATLLELLNKPESGWISSTPAVLSYLVVAGFFVLIVLLITESVTIDAEGRVAELVYICVGAVTAGFSTVLNFWLGSSLGSRRKDSSVALSGAVDKLRELDDPPAPYGPATGGTANEGGGVSRPSGDVARDGTPSRTERRSLPAALAGVGRSTDPSTVNVRRDVPRVGETPASFRYNNPGAQYPSREAARFGQIAYGVIGGGHKIAAFPSVVNGAAANFDLLYRRYTGMTIHEAGRKWTGRNAFGVPGYDDNLVLSQEMLTDREQAIALLKAIAERESGRGVNLTSEQWRYAHEMFRSRSADAFLARYGADVGRAIAPVRPDGAPDELLEVLLTEACEKAGYELDRGEGEINVVYVEGMNEDGSPNNDEPNVFNDLRCLVGFRDGAPFMVGKWNATTEPGFYYDRDHPMRREGAARIKFGQYKAWRVGMHKGDYEALVQVSDVTVCRDLNRDMERVGDMEHTGDDFGINQHGGYDRPQGDIGKASAGCLVGRTMAGHDQFMALVKQDPRYLADHGYVFRTTILPAADVTRVES
ncbi:hypothetical protein [Aureimonas jatrophae]|uniref:Uncharacterized protein n=1 Tax=Aureimonas jatrophae TaxID=1166073 RepID=A0A1H0M2S2_9HYPH|nr:hypothetical protein [Aureimonas jatrophae]MBB3952646.1 hypothetical protein [Aureimonas jatrophae]SDO74748.1 hypothetical protein SAMN05192530_11246 [Aureimonas jatrophae]